MWKAHQTKDHCRSSPPGVQGRVHQRSGFRANLWKGPDRILSEELDIANRHPESNKEGSHQSNPCPRSTSGCVGFSILHYLLHQRPIVVYMSKFDKFFFALKNRWVNCMHFGDYNDPKTLIFS